jgi:hypothetical protein
MDTWIHIGAVLVHRQSRRVVEITALDDDLVTVEYDDDGSIQEYSAAEIGSLYEPWTEGAEVIDRTGKGRFANPEAWRRR